jgi:hypothetical protein
MVCKVCCRLFLATGSLKVFNYDKAKQQAGQDSPTKGLTALIGLSEMAERWAS